MSRRNRVRKIGASRESAESRSPFSRRRAGRLLMRHAWKSWFHSCRIDSAAYMAHARRALRVRMRTNTHERARAHRTHARATCASEETCGNVSMFPSTHPSLLPLAAEQSIFIVAYARIRKERRMCASERVCESRAATTRGIRARARAR